MSVSGQGAPESSTDSHRRATRAPQETAVSPLSEAFDRMPPQDLNAEVCTLGSMLLSKDAIAVVQSELVADDFYLPAHVTVYEVIAEIYAAGEPVDPVIVADALTKHGQLERVGGLDYLSTLIMSVPTAANAGYYARIVREKAVLRRLVQAGTRVTQLGYTSQPGDVEELVNQAQAEVYNVNHKRQSEDYVAIGQLLDAVNLEIEVAQSRDASQMTGIPTGFTELDELTGGLQAGQMVIVAARPAMGKSTLALDFCRSASVRHGKTSCYFSLEMGRMEIMMRLLAAEAAVELTKLRGGMSMSDQDWLDLAQAYNPVDSARLFIDDSPNLTMPEIRSKCIRMKDQEDLGMVVVDYLQLMSSGKRVESRQQEVSEFSRQLKLLAKELEVPVIAVAQLNRGPEQREGKKPQMSDLRESGSLEQDADIIMLLHRPSYYDPEQRPGEADIIVAKHRNGETRTIPVAFQGHLARFANMARDVAPEPAYV